MADKCPWCKWQKSVCTLEVCDFKTLPYEKEEILKRLREESANIERLKVRILAGKENLTNNTAIDELAGKIVDVTAGMKIMVAALNADFGMKPDEVRERIGVKKTSLRDKLALAKALNAVRR